MSDSRTSYQSAIDNLKPEARKEALQKVIEIGGLDRELMVELRNQFLKLTERRET